MFFSQWLLSHSQFDLFQSYRIAALVLFILIEPSFVLNYPLEHKMYR